MTLYSPGSKYKMDNTTPSVSSYYQQQRKAAIAEQRRRAQQAAAAREAQRRQEAARRQAEQARIAQQRAAQAAERRRREQQAAARREAQRRQEEARRRAEQQRIAQQRAAQQAEQRAAEQAAQQRARQQQQQAQQGSRQTGASGTDQFYGRTEGIYTGQGGQTRPQQGFYQPSPIKQPTNEPLGVIGNTYAGGQIYTGQGGQTGPQRRFGINPEYLNDYLQYGGPGGVLPGLTTSPAVPAWVFNMPKVANAFGRSGVYTAPNPKYGFYDFQHPGENRPWFAKPKVANAFGASNVFAAPYEGPNGRWAASGGREYEQIEAHYGVQTQPAAGYPDYNYNYPDYGYTPYTPPTYETQEPVKNWYNNMLQWRI